MIRTTDLAPVEMAMLWGLYHDRERSRYSYLPDILNKNCDWKNVANNLKHLNFIEYPQNRTYSTIGRITDEGVYYVDCHIESIKETLEKYGQRLF